MRPAREVPCGEISAVAELGSSCWDGLTISVLLPESFGVHHSFPPVDLGTPPIRLKSAIRQAKQLKGSKSKEILKQERDRWG